MPTYEYRRKDGSTFELFQSMSDKTLTTCPTTGQPVIRIISGGTRILFKGTGFYVTDYKTDGSKNGDTKSENKSDEKKPAANKKAGSGSDSKAKE